MTLYFTPPTRAGRLLAPKERPRSFDLFRHFLPMEEGVNVYILEDGTVTVNDGLASESNVAHTFHGGHICQITPALQAVLVAAGYADNITET